MNRRDLLRGLIGAGLAAAADPERLLWTPGARTIFVPPAPTLAIDTEIGIAVRIIRSYDLSHHWFTRADAILWIIDSNSKMKKVTIAGSDTDFKEGDVVTFK